ncbi:MAG: TIGR03619 family F420-dependent LLM class oxidoreductase [Actinomycetia bacterium]|nr:TIGR03619 family F420-dependent LLM class oxidoreductase [Actinomycetes bacterium]
MAAIIPEGETVWGFQLPIQSQSTIYVQPWEVDAGTAELADIVAAADRAGAFYVAVCDHVGIPRPADEAMSATWYDTIATLGWIAGITESVHLLSHVYVLPYRPAPMTAKAFCTLDSLSGGRAILGVGAGHLKSEFQMLGVDHATRGADLEAAIPVIRSAFEESYPVVDFGGEHHEVAMSPRPDRAGGPPIWVGGSSPAAIRRAAQFADGWLPQGPPEIGTRAAIARIHELREEAGLPAAFDMGFNCAPVHLDGTNTDEVAEGLRTFAGRGINQLQMRFTASSTAEYCEQVERFGADVAPLLNQ